MTPTGIGDWASLRFFRDTWPDIAAALTDDPRNILPPDPLRFAALARTQPADTRVVILGQDPYPTAGHANGLAFSVAPDVPLPRSLKNIYRELEDDLGRAPATGDLGFWADQGVLLLNTALSVPEGDAGAHAKLGWSALASEIIDHLSDTPRAFVFWGKPAQKFGTAAVRGDHHLILTSPHPSPLSARRGFFGSRPFSQINKWLAAQGGGPIDWA